MMDYPGMIASVVFTQGCNFKCPYCHNEELIPIKTGLIDEEDVMAHLSKNKYLLDGVVITGGEPTLQKQLIPFILKIKNIGLAVKLDTNGSNNEVLKQLVKDQLINYIAMDIKSALTIETYALNTGINFSENTINNLKKSIQLIIRSGIKHEFRTTVCKELIAVNDIYSIIDNIKKAENYYIQQYKPNLKTPKILNPFNNKELTTITKSTNSLIKNIQIRN